MKLTPEQEGELDLASPSPTTKKRASIFSTRRSSSNVAGANKNNFIPAVPQSPTTFTPRVNASNFLPKRPSTVRYSPTSPLSRASSSSSISYGKDYRKSTGSGIRNKLNALRVNSDSSLIHGLPAAPLDVSQRTNNESDVDDLPLITPLVRRKKRISKLPGMPMPVSSSKRATNLLNPFEFDMAEIEHGLKDMSESLPVTTSSETVILRSDEKDNTIKHEEYFETISGERIATLDVDPESGRRTLRDLEGNLCAVILHTLEDGHNYYKVCCRTKMNSHMRKSRESGFYTWGEIRNSTGINVKFSMKVRGGTRVKFVTEAFGPSLFNWKNPRGFLIKKGSQPCARITYLNDSRAVVLAPNVDKCLLLCFAAIVEEMVGNRLR